MATKKTQVITVEGLKALEDELTDLKVNRRHEIAEKIKEARGHGDLSENAEYDAAKNEQAEIEARIEELEEILKHVEVVDTDDLATGKVGVGSYVKITNVATKQSFEYKIVGPTEANYLENKISNESPLGHELMGKKKGDKIVVVAPAGESEYKIDSVKKNK